jgi:hypothetical protein
VAASKSLQQYRQTIEEALAGLGRDDMAVADVAEVREGILSVTFSRGTHMSTAEIPTDQLQDREGAQRAVRGVMLDLSKRVARESLQQA